MISVYITRTRFIIGLFIIIRSFLFFGTTFKNKITVRSERIAMPIGKVVVVIGWDTAIEKITVGMSPARTCREAQFDLRLIRNKQIIKNELKGRPYYRR